VSAQGAKQRLDTLIVERGLAESRARAQALILAGRILVGERRAEKPAALIDIDAQIRIKGQLHPYVSRGGLKLERALEHFQLSAEGKVCADIGASTGGFTDCLLRRGAAKVYAIDVGYGQLHHTLRTDPRVVLRERVNARFLTAAQLPEPVDVLTLDVSFISLRQVLPPVLRRLKPGGTVVALVKPQFEVGREKVGKGGVVKDPLARAQAIEGIAKFVAEQGLSVLGCIDSPIEGPAGNLEALLAAALPVSRGSGSPPAG
jgi:23S rRNA (cytidine1920-2'-O)/16S rRNA (cytidine1409-2'-O)-methyltransferase